MLSKKASLFLLIGICAWLLNFLFHEISNYVMWGSRYPRSLMDWIITLVYFLPPVSLIPLAIAGMKQNFRNRKTIGLLIAIASGLWLGYLLYSHILSIVESDSFFSRLQPNPFCYFVFRWVGIIPPIALMLFGIALTGHNQTRLKRNSTWFIAGGLIYLFSHLGYSMQEWFLNSTTLEMEDWLTVRTLLGWLKLLYPIGLIAAGVSARKKLHPVALSSDLLEAPLETASAEQQESPRVIDWFENYLLSGIPIIGPVFLFVWGIDHSNRIRRNWALTFFLALILRTLLNLVVIVPYVLFSDIGYLLDIAIEESNYLTFAWTVIFLLIIAGSALLIMHFNNKPDTRDPGDPNPSIGTWIGNFFILAVPLVGIICLIVWAIDNRNDIVRRWAIARLLWGATILAFSLYTYVWALEIVRLRSQYVHFQF